MIYMFIFIVLSIGYCMLMTNSSRAVPAQKTAKITNILFKMLSVLPIPAFAVFAVLFSTVLKGRLMERASHAFIVFGLWMYATSFYALILKYFKNRIIFGVSLAGLAGAVVCAVFFTPLDRYCALLFDSLQEASFLGGGFMLALWYFSFWKLKRSAVE